MSDSTQHRPALAGRTQNVVNKHMLSSDKWDEFEVTTHAFGEIQSRVQIRATKDTDPFVDISIEEYTGATRRAKYVGVRLHEGAARRLYEALTMKFGGGV